ncbi:hypothetical protein [Sorangium sp. So ce176]|uniref:hypothetical protein n=1 Tax=Sorangium sp. So ce176 TaxID=3133286 RepID=UPI003F5D806A
MPAACIVVMTLVILGGPGFPVHDELLRRARLRLRGERPPRLSLHSRVVLITTAVLLAVGAAGFLALERGARGYRVSAAPVRVAARPPRRRGEAAPAMDAPRARPAAGLRARDVSVRSGPGRTLDSPSRRPLKIGDVRFMKPVRSAIGTSSITT